MMVWVTAGGCGGGGGGGSARGESGKHWGLRGRFRRENSSRSGKERGVRKDGGGGGWGGRGTRMLSSKQKDGANHSVQPFLFRVGGKW